MAATMKRIKADVRILMFSGVSDVPENARIHIDAFISFSLLPTSGSFKDSNLRRN